MKNYYIHLKDIPRRLKAAPRLHSFISFTDAAGTWKGLRPGYIEFALRLQSSDILSRESQDGIHYETPFPHVFIKKPHSEFYTGDFAPRRAVALIYDQKEHASLLSAGFTLSRIAWPLDLNNECSETITKMERLCDKLFETGSADRIDTLALKLLTELYLQRPEDDSNSNESFYEKKICQAASYFSLHYGKEIDFDRKLKEWGISRRTFFRYWKKYFNFTPKQYVIRLRLREAERRLGYDMSIAEIAESLCFNDLSNFTTQFKKMHGMTPQQYRMTHR